MNRDPQQILHVDDNEANRFAVKLILENAGFRVLEAGSGGEGLRLAAEERPDLVVLDIKLPDIGGVEVCRRLKSGDATRRIPILHLSNHYRSGSDKAAALQSGADGYLTQPVEPEELIATIRALLRVKAAEERYEVLLEAERYARAKAESAELRMNFLAEASNILSRTLDPREALAGLARFMVPSVATVCFFQLFDEASRRLRTVAVGSIESESETGSNLAALLDQLPNHTCGAAQWPARVIQCGETELYDDIGAALGPFGEDGRLLHNLLSRLGADTCLTTPLTTRNRCIGALTVLRARRAGGAFRPEDVTFFVDLASRAALAIDNATLYQTAFNNEERLRLAIDTTGLGTWDYDAKKNELLCSPRFKDIWGIAPSEPCSIAELEQRMPRDEFKAIARTVRAAITSRQEELEFEHTLRTPAGDVRIVAVKARLIYAREGEALRLVSLLGTAFDVTGARTRERELREAKDAAEKANSTKTQFLANMSHEIRTPLGIIIGFTDLLLEPEQTETERGECIDTIRRNGMLLAELINDILDLSKVEAGEMHYERVQFNLSALIAEVEGMFRPRASAKNIELKVAFDGPVPEAVETDPMRLRQILFNTLGNAIKFTEQGSVRLSLRLVAPHDEQGAQIELKVDDTGIGISAEEQAKLFMPFVQADSSTTRRFGGTGLGLVLARRLARDLGGDLELATSRPGEGSTFVARIGVGIPEGTRLLERYEPDLRPVPGATPDAKRPKQLAGARVLLVEDAVENQFVVTHYLKEEGAGVSIASNGLDGVREALGGEYDVVLMDMQMPVMDGYEATAELRQAGFARPIVALTAHAMKMERDRCLEIGCDEHISKPVDREQLVKIVSRLVGGSPERGAS